MKFRWILFSGLTWIAILLAETGQETCEMEAGSDAIAIRSLRP